MPNDRIDTTQDVMLDSMTNKAKTLVNGNRGDVGVLCDVVCDIAHVMASMARGGCRLAHVHIEDPAREIKRLDENIRRELQSNSKRRLTWPALWAYLATLGTFGTFLWVLLDYLLTR